MSRQAWMALRDTAIGLLNVANAILAEGGAVPPGISLSPSPLPDDSVTVSEAINQFLKAKARAGKSDRYLRSLKNSLSKFARGRGRRPLAAITAAEVESWLHGEAWAGRTKRGYLGDVRTLFNFAVRRNQVGHNPANGVELPEADSGPIRIHTPDQVRTVMQFAVEYGDPQIVRSLAVRYFAGLRSIEVTRLTENGIRSEDGIIEIGVMTSKGGRARRRRIVTIQPNLMEWLKLGGELPLHDSNNRMRWFTAALKARHGLEWEHNVTRHTFCSYHLSRWQNAAKTALEAGHTEQMLFSNYRQLVTPADADAFWQIVP